MPAQAEAGEVGEVTLGAASENEKRVCTQDLCTLRPSIRVEKEVGSKLGFGEVLF